MATNSTSGTAAAKVETVTLRQLAEGLSESHELPKKQVMGMLEEMVGDITKHLKRGARIRIGGLGILQVRKRPARMGRNPATGEADQDQGQQEGRLPRRQGPEGSPCSCRSRLRPRLTQPHRSSRSTSRRAQCCRRWRSTDARYRRYFSGECGAGSMMVECISSSSGAASLRNAAQPGSLTASART